MTVNGYFTLNPVFAGIRIASETATFEKDCMKTNKDRPILSAAKMFSRQSSFWQYKVCADIRAGSLDRRRQTKICCSKEKLTILKLIYSNIKSPTGFIAT